MYSAIRVANVRTGSCVLVDGVNACMLQRGCLLEQDGMQDAVAYDTENVIWT